MILRGSWYKGLGIIRESIRAKKYISVEHRYCIPGKYHFPVITTKMRGPAKTPTELMHFFLDDTFPQSMFFAVFTSFIYNLKKENIWKVCSWRVLPGSIYFFLLRRFLCSSVTRQGSKDAPGSSRYEGILHHLWTAGTCFWLWVTSRLHHSSYRRYVTLANDCVPRSESILSSQRKRKMLKLTTPANRRQRTRCRSRSIKGAGEKANIGHCAWYHVRQGNLR